MRQLLTVREVCRRLGLCKQRIHQLIAAGRIKATKIHATCWIIAESDLAAYIPGKNGRPKKETPMTSRLTALETAYANARDLDFPAIRVIVAEAFAGLDKAQAIALARQFGIRKTLPSKAAAVADAERKIAERLGSWQRCQFREQGPSKKQTEMKPLTAAALLGNVLANWPWPAKRPALVTEIRGGRPRKARRPGLSRGSRPI